MLNVSIRRMMREGKNGERQQKFIESTRKTDQYITQDKSKMYQKNRRKEKAVEEDKIYEKIEGGRYQRRGKYNKKKQKN